MWYRSLYWRIGIGFIAVLGSVMVVQAMLFLWLTGRTEGWLTIGPPERLASVVASDVSAALATDPGLQVEQHVRQRFRNVAQPFVVVMADGRVAANGTAPPPPGLVRAARVLLRYRPSGTEEAWPSATGVRPEEGARTGDETPRPSGEEMRGPGGEMRPGERPRRFGEGGRWPGSPTAGEGPIPGADSPRPPGDVAPVDAAPIEVAGERVGLVVVSSQSPPLAALLRQFGPTLALVGLVLLAAGTAVGSLLIFRPAHQRMRRLEQAAVALGQGRISVRASEEGSDEVSSVARTFNRMASALEESDAARRRLLADVSHELRTPLTAIRGYVETLEMPDVPFDEETRRRYLRIVTEETGKLETIVGDLLDLARLEGGSGIEQFGPVHLERLFSRVSDRHGHVLAGKNIALELNIDPAAGVVWGDADRLEQALQNLAANAVRHTPEGGRIRFSAEEVSGNSRFVRIAVEDSGPGIPEEEIPRLFDRFYKVDLSRAAGREACGSGLGLSIVRAIVERHGGSVTASNMPGGGASFTLLIPSPEAVAR
jgi:signal transduction histidine kinase